MRSDRTRIETGAIGEDDGPKSFVFTWRNTGDKPLVTPGGRPPADVPSRLWKTAGQTRRNGLRDGDLPPQRASGTLREKIFIFTQLAGNAPRRPSNSPVRSSPRPVRPTPIRTPAETCSSSRRRSGSKELAPRSKPSSASTAGTTPCGCGSIPGSCPPASGPDSPQRPSCPGGVGELTVRFDPAAGKPPGAFRSSCGDWGSSPGRAPSWSASPHPTTIPKPRITD